MRTNQDLPPAPVRRPIWTRLWIWCGGIIMLLVLTVIAAMFLPGLEFKLGNFDSVFQMSRQKIPERDIESFSLHIGDFRVSRTLGSNEFACTVYPQGWTRQGGFLLCTGTDRVFSIGYWK